MEPRLSRNTLKLYGNALDPGNGGGHIREFHEWCHAGPGAMVYGLRTGQDKLIRETIPSHTSVMEFIHTHLILRPCYDLTTRQFSDYSCRLNGSAVTMCIRALQHLWNSMASRHPEGSEDFTIRYPKPTMSIATVNADLDWVDVQHS